MENIIAPVDRKKLLEELSDDKFLRLANYGGSKIYVFQAQTSPMLMQEVGRLRELSFRQAGGGTGKSCDIDSADLSDKPYSQLIVWNDAEQEILGGYRFKDLSRDVEFSSTGQPELSTSEIFNFSDTFIKEYMPMTIELGRVSFSRNIKAKTTLDLEFLLWTIFGTDLVLFIVKGKTILNFSLAKLQCTETLIKRPVIIS